MLTGNADQQTAVDAINQGNIFRFFSQPCAPEILTAGTDLTETEREIVDGVPESARDLIANIPRLKPVSEVVYLQNKGFDGSGLPKDELQGSEIPLEARILKILVDLESQAPGIHPTQEAFKPELSGCVGGGAELSWIRNRAVAVTSSKVRYTDRSGRPLN